MVYHADKKLKITEMTPSEAAELLDSGETLHTIQKHWLEVKAGRKEMPPETGKRGPDSPKAPRQVARKASVARRYHEQTGRYIEQDMADERMMCAQMYETAAAIEDPEERFKALAVAQKALAAFNKTWLPYQEQRLGTLQSDSTVEDQKSWDEMLSRPVLEQKDGDN